MISLPPLVTSMCPDWKIRPEGAGQQFTNGAFGASAFPRNAILGWIRFQFVVLVTVFPKDYAYFADASSATKAFSNAASKGMYDWFAMMPVWPLRQSSRMISPRV